MSEQLESNLRTALRERASLVPGASVERLAGRDYHPRRGRLRPPVAIGATATAAAAAGAATLVFSLGAGVTSAFAGWTPNPTPPAPGQLQAAQASCESGQSPVSDLPLKLADTRGPFTFSVYANSQTSATCIKGPSFMAVSSTMSSAPVSAPDGQVLLSSAHPPTRPGQSSYSYADGRTGAGVSAVTLVLDDGTTVQATVGNGWFVAWWPGDHQVKAAQVTTPAGVRTQTFNFPPAPGPGGASHGRASGVSGSGSGSGGGASVQSFGSSVSR